MSRDETMSQLPPGSQRSETLTLNYRFKFHSPSRDKRLWKSGPRSPRRPGENKLPNWANTGQWGQGARARRVRARRAETRPGSEGARALHVTRPAGGDAHDAPLTWSVSSPVAGGGGRGRVPVASHPEELVAQL